MSSLIGTVDHYVRGSSFSDYMERMNILFILNNISDSNKKNLFITLSGPVIFEEVKLIFPGATIASIDYTQMVNKLKERLDKTKPNMLYRHKFNSRMQGIDEPAENYVLALKLLASQCGFGGHKDEAIKDKIIFGMRDEELKHTLLMKDNMKLEEVEELVVRTELAKLRAKEVKERDDEHRSVNSVKYRLGNRAGDRAMRNDSGRPVTNGYGMRYRSRSRSPDREYKRFASSMYGRRLDNRTRRDYPENRGYRSENPHANVICNYCKKRGHVKRNCFKLTHRRTVNFVEKEEEEETEEQIETYDFKRLNIRDSEEEEHDYPCMMISAGRRHNEPCLVEVMIENNRIKMEIDCGSAVTVISLAMYRKHFAHIQVAYCTSRLVVVNGQQLNIFGKIFVNVNVNNIQHLVHLIVLDDMRSFVPLFGRNWLDLFYPGWRNVFGSSVAVNKLNDDQQSFTMGFEADLVLKEERPVFRKAYEVPFKLKDKVIEHLESLERQNIITPIQIQHQGSQKSTTHHSITTNGDKNSCADSARKTIQENKRFG
ncbi:uncharacterized protein LOC134223430 [Armigeres subalbatus]|uniref:uncharacterized protein LOC134223430 n=1 Tax=Armigeres subalbatus TaxID=124917 RepID=UPI002ED17169